MMIDVRRTDHHQLTYIFVQLNKMSIEQMTRFIRFVQVILILSFSYVQQKRRGSNFDEINYLLPVRANLCNEKC